MEHLEHQDSREFVVQMVLLDSQDPLDSSDNKECVVILDILVQLVQLGSLDHKEVLVQLDHLDLLAHVEIQVLPDLLGLSDNKVRRGNVDHREQLVSLDHLDQMDNLENKAQLVLKVPKVMSVHRDFLELQAVPVGLVYLDNRVYKDNEEISVQADSLEPLDSEVKQVPLATLDHKDRRVMLEQMVQMVQQVQLVPRVQQVTKAAKETQVVLVYKEPLARMA